MSFLSPQKKEQVDQQQLSPTLPSTGASGGQTIYGDVVYNINVQGTGVGSPFDVEMLTNIIQGQIKSEQATGGF